MKQVTLDNLRLKYENKLVLYTSLDCTSSDFVDEAIRASINRVADWPYVFRSLMHHGTLFTFSKHATRLKLLPYLPDEFVDELNRTVLILRYRNSRFAAEMKRISAAFNKEDIPMVFIKGAMLLLSGYYDEDSRFMDDLDCIVPHEQMLRSKELLENIGYMEPDSVGQPVRYHYKGEMQFVNARDREIEVELSARLNKNYELTQCYPFKDEELVHKLTKRTIKGVEYQIIEKEFHFIYCLFHHVALNYLHRLNWLNDFYLMLMDRTMDMDKVHMYLDAYGLRKSWNLLLSMLFHHFHVQIERPGRSVSRRLQALFLTDTYGFVNLGVVEKNNVSVRFMLINSNLNKSIVVIKKILLPPEWLREYYKLDPKTPAIVVYYHHYKKSIKRFFKIGSANERKDNRRPV